MRAPVSLLALAAAAWAMVIYNRLVREKNRVLAAWGDIDVQLKRRHDLIPKLVDAVKQYAAFERATISIITQLRAQSALTTAVGERARFEGALGSGLRRLLAVAERYPELKANKNFLALQEDLSDVESSIQYARRYYNGSVRDLNTRIDSFPDLFVARLFRFRPRDYFELEAAAERQSPELAG